MNTFVPYVTDRLGGTTSDIYSFMLKKRVIFLCDQINSATASVIVAQMLYLNYQKEEEIIMYINSPGGSIHAGMSVYDTMKHIASPVSIICMGMAASMAGFLLCAGTKGKRKALAHSRVMLHQPLTNLGDRYIKESDLRIEAMEMLKIRQEMYRLIAHNTKFNADTIEKEIYDDRYFTAQEALEYGIIDEIIGEI